MRTLTQVAAIAAVALACAENAHGKAPLNERFIMGPIRVFYTKDRIPEQLRALRYSDGMPVLRDHALNAVVDRSVIRQTDSE